MQHLVARLKKIRIWKQPRFRNEKKMLSGRQLALKNSGTSVLFATMHKAASVFAWSILEDIGREYGFNTADFDGYFYHEGRTRHPLEAGLFHDKGMFYGPFRRGFRHIGQSGDELDLNRFRIVLQLRDPRDVLTSSYYSFLHSHAVAPKDRERMKSVRSRMDGQNIEAHVRSQMQFFIDLLKDYVALFDHPCCLVLHYEDMVSSPERWSDQLIGFLELDDETPARNVLSRVVKSANDVPDVVRIDAHRRRVTPGEFRKVLPASLIAELNFKFSAYFRALERIGNLPESYKLAPFRRAAA